MLRPQDQNFQRLKKIEKKNIYIYIYRRKEHLLSQEAQCRITYHAFTHAVIFRLQRLCRTDCQTHSDAHSLENSRGEPGACQPLSLSSLCCRYPSITAQMDDHCAVAVHQLLHAFYLTLFLSWPCATLLTTRCCSRCPAGYHRSMEPMCAYCNLSAVRTTSTSTVNHMVSS